MWAYIIAFLPFLQIFFDHTGIITELISRNILIGSVCFSLGVLFQKGEGLNGKFNRKFLTSLTWYLLITFIVGLFFRNIIKKPEMFLCSFMILSALQMYVADKNTLPIVIKPISYLFIFISGIYTVPKIAIKKAATFLKSENTRP